MEYASKKSKASAFWLLMTLEATASQRDMPAKVGGKNDGGKNDGGVYISIKFFEIEMHNASP